MHYLCAVEASGKLRDLGVDLYQLRVVPFAKPKVALTTERPKAHCVTMIAAEEAPIAPSAHLFVVRLCHDTTVA
jgi:hypothetical protein